MSIESRSRIPPAKFSVPVVLLAVVGIVDTSYLTWHHLKHELVPCSVISGCETVLTSAYAEVAGIPLAAFGLAAYLIVFSMALLAVLGKTRPWFMLGIQLILMAAFSAWLLYLQAFVIHAFCQFCLLSATVTITMLAIALGSRFWRFR